MKFTAIVRGGRFFVVQDAPCSDIAETMHLQDASLIAALLELQPDFVHLARFAAAGDSANAIALLKRMSRSARRVQATDLADELFKLIPREALSPLREDTRRELCRCGSGKAAYFSFNQLVCEDCDDLRGLGRKLP